MPIIAAPLDEPVMLTEAKLHLRVDHADDDTLIASLIKTARQQAEHRTGRRYGVQTWERSYNAFPSWALLLPDPPVTAIVSIKYDDASAVEQTLDPAMYRLRPHSEPAAVMPVSAWPAALAEPGSVRIRYVCGLSSTDARWESLQAWMLLAVGAWYANREASGVVQNHDLSRDFWDGLLDPLRFYGTYTG